MSRSSVRAFLAVCIALSCGAFAADNYKLDPVHSVAIFKINHLGFSNTYGLAPNLEGEFTYDAEDASKCSITVTVKALDITTENTDRDDHVLGEDFLNAAEFETMSFKSTAWKETEKGKYEVAGDLTILGAAKPVTIQAELVGCGTDMQGNGRCGFDALLKIKRSDFGNSTMLPAIGDDVTLMIGIEGIKQ